MSRARIQVAKLLFLRALTPVHAGAGRGASEHVDLPVQRDEFGFPCIWASSLKGAVRGCLMRASSGQGDRECLYAALGPPPERAYEHSSAVSFLDARLLLMPARSLKGVWTYVTSPHMVGYLCTYLEAFGWHKVSENLRGALEGLAVPASSSKDILVSDSLAVLNELDVVVKSVDPQLPAKVFGRLLSPELVAALQRRGLVLLDDETAVEVVRRSMVIQYRVRLKETKTVDVGPWAEEYIPQEAVLVSAIVCRPPLSSKCENPCDWLLRSLSALRNVLWLGGKETVGRGLLRLYLAPIQGGSP